MRPTQSIFAIFIACCIITGSAHSQEPRSSLNAEVVEQVEALLQEFTNAKTGSGGAVIIEVDGEVIVRKGYGLANREKNIPFTTETIAQIGSITKQFTAAAIIQLAHEDKIDISARVDRYLTNAPDPVGAVTIHQLLTHTSGLSEYCTGDFDKMSLDQMLNECLSKPLLFKPGTDNAYSNPGFSVLAAIVEAASGKTLDKYLKDELFEPNGLHKTGYYFENVAADEFAHGYLEGSDEGVISDRFGPLGDDWWNLKGNGGIQASTEDMYRWYRAISGKGELHPDVVAKIRSPHSDWMDNRAHGYGWGFVKIRDGRILIMSHSGSDGVFYSYYFDLPDENVFLYFVGNSGEHQVLDELRAVRSVLMKAYIPDDTK